MTPNILLIDDCLDMREIVRKTILQNHSVLIEEAFSANSAIELLKNKNFDIVISDFHMPGGTGMEVFIHIASIDPKLLEYFIFFSSEKGLSNFIQNAACVCIDKLDLDKLKEVVSQLIDKFTKGPAA